MIQAVDTKFYEKWVQNGYDPSYIKTDPEAISFIKESRILRTIQLFESAKNQLQKANMGLQFDAKGILFKVQGNFQPYSEIKGKIKFDHERRTFSGWSYCHPDGFLPIDPICWTTLFPFLKLSKEAHEKLKKIADQFWTSSQPEVDPGVLKPCILQVSVQNKPVHSPIEKNVKNMLQDHHAQIRLVDEEGKVYSFGIFLNKKEFDLVFHEPHSFTFRTVNRNLSIPDMFELNFTTSSDSASIPISQERFLKMVDRAQTFEKMNDRFCMLNHNCCRLVSEFIEMSGVHVDVQMSLPQCLLESFPNSEDIPYVGGALQRVVHTTSSLQREAKRVCSLVPRPVKRALKGFMEIASFIPKKCTTFFCSLACLVKKSNQGSPLIQSNQAKQLFLINSVQDLFNEKTLVVYHTHLLKLWIQKQGSFCVLHNALHLVNDT